MNKTISLIAAGILVLGCQLLAPTPTQSAPTDVSPSESTSVDCFSLKITDADVQAARQYSNGALSADEWESNYNVASTYVIVSYVNNIIHARIEFISTIFCDAKNALKNDLDAAYFNNFFSAYDSYTIVDSCEKGDTVLYEVSAMYQNYKYSVRAWFEPLEDNNHAKVITMYFPETELEKLDFYSNMFFPGFTSCK